MSTVAEIERAALSLPREELERLLGRLSVCITRQPAVPPDKPWWESCDSMPEAEAEAFAADIESARQILNRPPGFPVWD